MELRKYPRFPVQFRSSFSSAQVVGGEGKGIDLSLRGCRVESNTEVQPGANLVLRIYMPGHDSPIEVDVATVRWTRGKQFGLEFMNMVAEERERLRQVVRDIELSVRLT